MSALKFLAAVLMIFSYNIATAEVSFPGGISKGIPIPCQISLKQLVGEIKADKTPNKRKSYLIDAKGCETIRIVYVIEDSADAAIINELFPEENSHLKHLEKINTIEKNDYFQSTSLQPFHRKIDGKAR